MATNGKGRRNAPPLYEVHGNAASMICVECGGPFLVSAFWHRQFFSHWQGWRICPHCRTTEATVYWSGYADDGRTTYEADIRYLTSQERAELANARPTKTGNVRIKHERQKNAGDPKRWR